MTVVQKRGVFFMICVCVANGFEEIEAISVIDILRSANMDVKIVSINDKVAKGAHGISIYTDMPIEEIDLNEVECVVLPGGIEGTENLRRSEYVRNMIRYCADNHKYIAAICAAPSILGEMNLLREKNAVCSPGFSERLKGANVLSAKVCVDDNFITANGPASAMEFALKIIEVLRTYKESEQVGKGLLCRTTI